MKTIIITVVSLLVIPVLAIVSAAAELCDDVWSIWRVYLTHGFENAYFGCFDPIWDKYVRRCHGIRPVISSIEGKNAK